MRQRMRNGWAPPGLPCEKALVYVLEKRAVMMAGISRIAAGLFLLASAASAAAQSGSAALFGARENVADISLSPDGRSVAYITPIQGSGSALYTVKLGEEPKLALGVDGRPVHLSWCNWVSDARLLCETYSYQKAIGQIYASTRLIAVDADGKNVKLVSKKEGDNALGLALYGGGVVDWLPGENGSVLMSRVNIPEARTGSLIEKRDQGLAVERVDTQSLKYSTVERAVPDAVDYISDGQGVVRIMGTQSARGATGYGEGKIAYFYRRKGERDWQPLSTYDLLDRSGFTPRAVDGELDVVYGFKKLNGRQALYTVALDGSMRENLVFAHDEVDVDGLMRLGRKRQVVGVSYATEKRQARYFDKSVAAMQAALARALPDLPQIMVLDSSADGNRMLVLASSDRDAGQYFVYDKTAKSLHKILLARPDLEGVVRAEVKPVRIKAADGTVVPGYLTLPAGGTGKNLPAIVMPHGGPEARDEWGFDWLAQFFANRGYAVLQPNFRGSSGYGDAWFQKNGFQSWRSAIGDVNDAGRWLVSQGIADPAKLAVVGWSYGGYAALQSNVVDPELYKAIVAVAPVTDFRMTIDESKHSYSYAVERERIGSGAHLREGSPLQNAARISAPVLIFHGDMDLNVGIAQSQAMAEKLRDAGKPVELVTYPGLAHNLGDGDTRADMLAKSDAFLRKVLGIGG